MSDFKRFNENTQGRDFVCGDLHGSFALLEQKLSNVRFNKDRDRLFCVGDLIDRGSGSVQALDYLRQSWFFTVSGNHECMMLDWCTEVLPDYRKPAFEFHMMNGGGWITHYLGVSMDQLLEDIKSPEPISVKYPELHKWVEAINNLPLVIEVKTSTGCVGIVHAEIPDKVTWANLKKKGYKPSLRYSILYSRKYISAAVRNGLLRKRIAGVNDIYCGHTILNEPFIMGNIHYIDTGAYSKNNLTLLQIN